MNKCQLKQPLLKIYKKFRKKETLNEAIDYQKKNFFKYGPKNDGKNIPIKIIENLEKNFKKK